MRLMWDGAAGLYVLAFTVEGESLHIEIAPDELAEVAPFLSLDLVNRAGMQPGAFQREESR